MHYLLTLLFLGGMYPCLARTLLPDTAASETTYLALAKSYEIQGDIAKAIDYYEQAKTHFAQEKDELNRVYVLDRLASLYISNPSSHEKAEAYLDSASAILEEKLHENDTLQAITWSTRAEFALAQRKFDEAIEYYQKSLERKRAFHGEQHLEIARAKEQIGSIYLYELQNPFESKQYFEQALEIRDYLGDQSRLLINCFYYLAVANRLQGDYDKALTYGSRALHGYEDLPEPSYKNIVFANNLLGNIYFDMDSIEAALGYNKKAIALAIRENLSQSIDMSLYYNNQAGYHFRKEAYDSTIYYARLAIAHQARPDYLANSYQFLGNAYWGKEQLDSAFWYYQQCRELKESIFDDHHTQLATLYVDLGRAFDTDQKVDSALHYYKKSLASAKISQGDTVPEVDKSIQAGDDLATMQEALTGMTNLLIKLYNQTDDPQYLAQALPYFLLFDRFMDLSRTNFSTEGSKLILSGNHKATYEKAIASSYQLYQSTQADSLLQMVFHFMEKSKAMVLLESIHQAERYQAVLPDSLIQQDQSLRAQLAYLQSEIIYAEQHAAESIDLSDWQLQKANVLQEIEALNQHIQTYYPNYYNFTYRDLTIRMDSLQKYVVPHQPVISYFWGDSAVYALLIASDTVKVHQIKNVAALEEAIRQYRDILVSESVFDPLYSNFLQFQKSAHTLYQVLLEPLLADDSLARLTIVPDGDLTKIPFESLITSPIETKENDIRYERLPYLIKAYEISYEFSLSVAFWEKQYTEAVSKENEFNVIAFGIKNFDNLPGNQRYPSLGGAEEEIQYVQEKFPQARIFLNADATETQFKMHAPDADILHLATHGMADLENPFTSNFIFYPDGEEDGTLHLYELYNIPLKAKVLLLSACESGVGKHYVGEGNFSLARSFVYAGCKSVVMSLWKVNDDITKQMVTGMYDQFAEQQTISEALRKTKLAFIEEGMFAHPQCWAGMVPLGNSSLEFPEQRYSNYLPIVWIVIGLGAIYLIRLLLKNFQYLNTRIHLFYTSMRIRLGRLRQFP